MSPIEFNSHINSFVRFLSEKIFGFFSVWTKRPQNDLKTSSKNFRLLTLLCKFCRIFEKHLGLKCWKRSTKKNRCPLCVSGKIIAVFYFQKISNWLQKWQKFENFTIFKVSISIFNFCEILDRLVNKNVETIGRGMLLLSNRLLSRDRYSLSEKNASNWPSTCREILNIPFLFVYHAIYVPFPPFLRNLVCYKVQNVQQWRD